MHRDNFAYRRFLFVGFVVRWKFCLKTYVTILVTSNKLIVFIRCVHVACCVCGKYLGYCHVLQAELHKFREERCSNGINCAARMEYAVDKS